MSSDNDVRVAHAAIINAHDTVISYEGQNFYRACDVMVTGTPEKGGSYCVLPYGHGGTEHRDFDGTVIDTAVPDFDFSSLSLGAAVHQAIGAASTCWESLSGTGVFDDKKAKNIADALMKRIRQAGPIYD